MPITVVDDVDYSVVETLRSVHARLTAKGIHLVVAKVMEDVMKQYRRSARS